VLLNSPKIGKYGGLAAAPIFKNVASRIVLSYPDRYLTPGSIKNKIDQQFAVKQSNRIQIVSNVVQTSVPKITDRSRMPDLINSSVRDALKILNELGIDYKVKGSGRIVSQSILPGEKINKGASCFLVCEEIAVTGATIY
jgi:cell division protein FtsI (penicillin-binding protein 3)